MIARIISGIIGIALAAFIIQYGGWAFAAAAVLLSLAGWHEYARAFAHRGRMLAYFTGVFALLAFGACAWLGNREWLMAAIALATLLVLAEAVIFYSSFSIEEACISLGGILYLGLPFAHLVFLRFLEGASPVATPVGAAGDMGLGCALLWLALIGTWASDTFAYFVGTLIGRHKLCPAISPGKTVEGFLGGIIGAVASVIAAGHLFFAFSLPGAAILGLCIALVAPLGDLVESVIKRHTGIKDSGILIPGHGGVLDRFDSLMFSVPVVYYLEQFLHLVG